MQELKNLGRMLISLVLDLLLIKEFDEDVEEPMFGNGMKYRPFSFGEGIRGMRPIWMIKCLLT